MVKDDLICQDTKSKTDFFVRIIVNVSVQLMMFWKK